MGNKTNKGNIQPVQKEVSDLRFAHKNVKGEFSWNLKLVQTKKHDLLRVCKDMSGEFGSA